MPLNVRMARFLLSLKIEFIEVIAIDPLTREARAEAAEVSIFA
jgi:hypothetical protein